MCAVDSAPDGQVKHVEGEASQRADVHTDELNPSVGRYLCSIAAINAAEEVGPPTPDVNSLPFPNPCAVCGPSPQALASFPDAQPLKATAISQSSHAASSQGPAEAARMQEVWEPASNGRGLGRSQATPQEQQYDSPPPPPPPRPQQASSRSYGYGMQEDFDDAPVQRSAPAHASAMGESPDRHTALRPPSPPQAAGKFTGTSPNAVNHPQMPSNFTPLDQNHQQPQEGDWQNQATVLGVTVPHVLPTHAGHDDAAEQIRLADTDEGLTNIRSTDFAPGSELARGLHPNHPRGAN